MAGSDNELATVPSSLINISSSTLLTELNHHFRVMAGPGAGKTHWLVNHIQNVLRNSDKLAPGSRVACISYTTVAADEIRSRLKDSGDLVEVSTIHGFLYKNIVKPYLYLLKDDGQPMVNFPEVDGHVEHRPSEGKLRQWATSNSAYYLIASPANTKLALECLASLTWKLEDNSCLLGLRNGQRQFRQSGRSYSFPTGRAIEYKRMFWNEGVIHHEDVLYFSFQILSENPSLLNFLAARFPFIFLDEFQDTNPIQTQIVKWLAGAGALIGVIGDSAQSIYKFQDACRSDFLNFSLPEMQDYVIPGNRRSTQKIIDFLNHIRNGDIVQNCEREEDGHPVCLIVSPATTPPLDFVSSVRRILSPRGIDIDPTILARTNIEVANLRSIDAINAKVWESLNNANYKREEFLHHIIQSVEYAFHGRFETAVTEMIKIFKSRGGHLQDPFRDTCPDFPSILKRGLATALLEHLISIRATLLTQNAFFLYQAVKSWMSSAHKNLILVSISGGFKSVAESINYSDLAKTVKLSEETRNIRTIHNSKGCEFEATLLFLNDERDLQRLLQSPNIDEDGDETRILYVALSRTINHLFLSTPTLSDANRGIAEQLGMSVILPES